MHRRGGVRRSRTHSEVNTMAQATEDQTTRNTIQRSLVLEAVRSLHNHPTSADVYEVVRTQHPNISRATVYRNLGVLASRGDVLRVEVPNGADRYDYRHDDHFHAKCRECGQVFDIEMPRDRALMSHVEDAHGFKIDGYDLTFTGLCPACQRKAAETN